MAIEENYHDEDTLFKVYRAILSYVKDSQEAIVIISRIQNEGILFRERVPDGN